MAGDLRRYSRILGIQLRASLTLAVQFRLDFVVEGLLSLFWAAIALVPLLVVFHGRPAVAGWSFDEALVVMGWFTLLKGVLEGAINPSLIAVVDHVRKGTLDFVLLKPADAQFLVSTTRFEPWRIFDLTGATLIFVYAFEHLHRWPGLGEVMGALGMLLAAVLVLYSIWILVVSVAFFAVRIDNLSHFFNSIFDAARWPITVFKGPIRVFFTFVFPLALMTTFPAMALLGTLELSTATTALAGGLAFAVMARIIWKASIGHYTSASS